MRQRCKIRTASGCCLSKSARTLSTASSTWTPLALSRSRFGNHHYQHRLIWCLCHTVKRRWPIFQPDLDASPLGLAGLREILQRKLVSIPVLAWVGGHISDAGDFSRITSTSTDQTVQFTVAVEPWLGTNGLSGLHLDWRYSGKRTFGS